MKRLLVRVTLIVYGWHSNEPGTLAWVFPSLEAASRAARAMRNAVRWLIVAGERATGALDVDALRRDGVVLMEASRNSA